MKDCDDDIVGKFVAHGLDKAKQIFIYHKRNLVLTR